MGVEQDDPAGWQIAGPPDRMTQAHRAAERFKVGSQRPGDGGRPTFYQRPSTHMGQGAQHQADGGGRRRTHRTHPVGGQSGEQGPGRLGAEPPGDHRGGEQPRRQRERRERSGSQGFHHRGGQSGPVFHNPPDGTPPHVAVGTETGAGLIQRPPQRRCPAITERMGDLDVRDDPPDPELLQLEPGEQRGGHSQRVEGRANVVPEAGQGEFLGTGAPTDGLTGFEDQDAVSVLGQHHSRRQAVGSRPDDDGFVGSHAQPAVPSRGAGDRVVTGTDLSNR